MEKSFKEERIKKIIQLYYSKPEIQKTIYEFCKNREISPRYFEGFGKRPDTFQYPNDILEFVKRGATSFHCSEEIWKDPLQIVTGMSEAQYNEIRTGWDLLIDIDSKYIDYSKISAEIIISFLKFHGIKNIGVKFSGSKGFHIVVPWKAFPKKVFDQNVSDKFPEYPRIITQYIMDKTNKMLVEKISNLERPNKYVKDFKVSEKVMPDLILVAPRHLFRTPYSLHEKTALASVVLEHDEVPNFQLKDADPLTAVPKNFYPDAKEGEATKLLIQALDWFQENKKEDEVEKATGKYADFKPIKLDQIEDKNFPPCVQKILKGIGDGKKRAVFVLINFFRSIGMDKEELEKRIYEWNQKNETPLREGYILAQLKWSFARKPIMPPNCQEFYKGIGVCQPDNYCRWAKNPVNYTIKKSLSGMKSSKKKSLKNKRV